MKKSAGDNQKKQSNSDVTAGMIIGGIVTLMFVQFIAPEITRSEDYETGFQAGQQENCSRQRHDR